MLKKIKKILMLVLVMMVAVNAGVFAMGKLINTPTADLAGSRGLIYGEMTLDSYKQIEGIYNISPQLEVGGVIQFIDEEQELGLQAKTILSRETEKDPAIAAGIKKDDIYFVISKNIGLGFRGHLGIGNGSLDGIFIGFNKVLNPVNISENGKGSMPVINLMGEYTAQQLNLGARINLQQNIKFDIAVIDLDSLKLGLGYMF